MACNNFVPHEYSLYGNVACNNFVPHEYSLYGNMACNNFVPHEYSLYGNVACNNFVPYSFSLLMDGVMLVKVSNPFRLPLPSITSAMGLLSQSLSVKVCRESPLFESSEISLTSSLSDFSKIRPRNIEIDTTIVLTKTTAERLE